MSTAAPHITSTLEDPHTGNKSWYLCYHRAALDRLLDPEYESVTLSTLRKAALAVGRELRLELV
jgi:hypothetical protein